MQGLKRVRRVGPTNFALKSLAAEQMQDRALASLRSRSTRPRPVLLALAVAATGFACTQKGPLSDEEMEQLRAFMLPAGPPDDPSNAFADNPAAIALGKQLYFETRYAGALVAPYNATDVNGNARQRRPGPGGQTGKVGCASCHDPATGGADAVRDRTRPAWAPATRAATHRP